MTQWDKWMKRADRIHYDLRFILRRAGISRQTRSNWKRGCSVPAVRHVESVEHVFHSLEHGFCPHHGRDKQRQR